MCQIGVGNPYKVQHIGMFTWKVLPPKKTGLGSTPLDGGRQGPGSVYLRSELLKPLTNRGNENNNDDSYDDDCTYLITLAHNDSGDNNVDDDEKQ